MAEPDFTGWATRNDLRCTDGRVIRHDAFRDNDGKRVPLVWQHSHSNIENVIGHAELENRPNGVYARGFLNATPQADIARDLLLHKDINSMSIFANKLQQTGPNVVHGNIVEVSLVLSPANPGALIENVSIQHSDGSYEDSEEEAVISAGIELDEEDAVATTSTNKENVMKHADADADADADATQESAPAGKTANSSNEETQQDVLDSLNDKQRNVAMAMIAMASGDTLEPVGATVAHAETLHANKDKAEKFSDVWATFSDKQKTVVSALIALAASHASTPTPTPAAANTAAQSDIHEGDTMSHANVFEPGSVIDGGVTDTNGNTLSHSEVAQLADDIVDFAITNKIGLKDAIAHAAKEYGISNVEELFPNAKVSGAPTWVKPEDEWVASVLDATSHTPFARLKSTQIDLTEDKLRAKGYITADQKKDGVFRILNRETTPQTVYIRSKLDRDDIIDVTEHDIVAYTKEAMRIKFRYELARAILVGDGREIDDREKIQESHIRPVYSENDFYAAKVVLPASLTNAELPEKILRSQKNFKGHGVPTFFTTFDVYMDMLLSKDEKDSNRRLYKTDQELTAALHVNKIVVVDELEGVTRTTDKGGQALVGILVNMSDYSIGRDRGGDIFNAEDFDIDFNQYKYLMETRLSGALVEPKTAIVIERLAA